MTELRVAIAGARRITPEEAEWLRGQWREVRRELRQRTASRIVYVSGLALGVDQLLSRAVIEEPYPDEPVEEIAAILPFRRERCDPSGELLSRCVEVVELAGDDPAPHRAQAEELLRRCDLLVAAARPGPARGEGGTAETVERARAAGFEVVELWLQRKTLHAAAEDAIASAGEGSG